MYGNMKAHTGTCRYMQVAYIRGARRRASSPSPPPPRLGNRGGDTWGPIERRVARWGPHPYARNSWVVLTALLYVGHETRSHQHEEHKRTLHAFNSSSAWYLYSHLYRHTRMRGSLVHAATCGNTIARDSTKTKRQTARRNIFYSRSTS